MIINKPILVIPKFDILRENEPVIFWNGDIGFTTTPIYTRNWDGKRVIKITRFSNGKNKRMVYSYSEFEELDFWKVLKNE